MYSLRNCEFPELAGKQKEDKDIVEIISSPFSQFWKSMIVTYFGNIGNILYQSDYLFG